MVAASQKCRRAFIPVLSRSLAAAPVLRCVVLSVSCLQAQSMTLMGCSQGAVRHAVKCQVGEEMQSGEQGTPDAVSLLTCCCIWTSVRMAVHHRGLCIWQRTLTFEQPMAAGCVLTGHFRMCADGAGGGRGRCADARQAQPRDGGILHRTARHPNHHLRQRRCAQIAFRTPSGQSPYSPPCWLPLGCCS